MNRHNISFDAAIQREPVSSFEEINLFQPSRPESRQNSLIKVPLNASKLQMYLCDFSPEYNFFQIPSTPDNLRRYRRHTSVGRRDGDRYDKLNSIVFQPNHVFGKKSGATNPVLFLRKIVTKCQIPQVSDVFKDESLTGMKGHMRQVKEARYGSNKE